MRQIRSIGRGMDAGKRNTPLIRRQAKIDVAVTLNSDAKPQSTPVEPYELAEVARVDPRGEDACIRRADR